MNGYSVAIKESSRELTAKQRIALKDLTNAVRLDEATQVEPVVIDVDMYAILNVHNEKSENPDYNNYVIVDKNGTKFVTGSESFWSSFKDIYDEMSGEDEDYSVKVYRVPSKNYKGKDFITCSIV